MSRTLEKPKYGRGSTSIDEQRTLRGSSEKPEPELKELGDQGIGRASKRRNMRGQ